MKDKDDIIHNEELRNKKSVIMSVFKAYKILELFGEKNSLNFAEISERLDLPSATLYRF